MTIPLVSKFHIFIFINFFPTYLNKNNVKANKSQLEHNIKPRFRVIPALPHNKGKNTKIKTAGNLYPNSLDNKHRPPFNHIHIKKSH
jgi:hypothetical protein